MSTDNLDTLSDAELNECFAVEVAGWTRGKSRREFKDAFWPPDTDKKKWPIGIAVTRFSTDANAVLPWLEKHTQAVPVWNDGEWSVDVNAERSIEDGYDITTIATATAPTFARAACIALIRAHRSQKATP